MQHKDLASILAGPSLTPQEAYRRASPAQRRAWFGDEAAAKTAQYDVPAAQSTGLPPHLERAVQQFQAQQYGDQLDPVCLQCKSAYPAGQGTVNGYCAHRAGPGTKAVRLAEAQRARLTTLYQQAKAGLLGDPVRVVPVGQAAQEDALRAGFHAMVDELLG